VPYFVRATPVAERQIAGLRGARRKAYDQFELVLAQSGCGALDYRLTGLDPLPSLCAKHLRGSDRAVVAFANDDAWVLLVGPHAAGETQPPTCTGCCTNSPASPAPHSLGPSRPAATTTKHHPRSRQSPSTA